MSMPAPQCRHLIALAAPIMDDLGDAHRALEPVAGVKTAGWLVGHLAVTGDFARKLAGRPPLCPAEWRALFNPGTQPSHDPATYPAMDALRGAFRAVYTDLTDAAPAGLSGLDQPNPFAPARAAFPTAGDFLAYLMTGHLAYHLGQLAAWRGAAGLARNISG
jgi:hypothetical protein